VLFAGSERLPPALAEAVIRADGTLPPLGALVTALADTGELLADSVTRPAQRRAVIKASPELQERERTKFAAVTDALARALQQRGTPEAQARLLARTGAAIFQTAFERWADQPEHASLPARVRDAAAELADSLRTAAAPDSCQGYRASSPGHSAVKSLSPPGYPGDHPCPAKGDANAIFSFLIRKLWEKFPARFALGISRLLASRPTAAIARLDNPKTTEPPVKATIETMKMSTRATNALPASTVRFSC
jgi:hypothetical protein